MHVKSGSYVGTGSAHSPVTALSFTPKAVIVKGGANIGVIRTDTMATDSAKPLTGTTALVTGCITSLDAGGFSVGTDARTNANGTTYHWLALGDDGGSDIETGSYAGNGSDGRNITPSTSFVIDLVMVMAATADGGVWFRTSDYSGDQSNAMDVQILANRIQSQGTGTFQVGTDAAVNTATGTPTYHWLALKNTASLFEVLTYTGDGADNRSVTGAGFQPDFALTKRAASTNAAVARFVDQAGDASFQVNASAETTNLIQAFQADGFQVGDALAVNNNAGAFYSFVFKETASNEVTPDPVLIEATVVQPAISLASTLAPVLIEATVVAPSIASPTEVIPDPVLIKATVIEPSITVGFPNEVDLDPVLIEALVIEPSISISLLPPETLPFVATQPGKTEIHFYDPTWTEVVPDAPVYLLNWETHKFQNRIGNWAASLPIDNGLIDGVPLHRQIRCGWHISFRQLNNHPLNDEDLWLLYLGVIQTRDYDSQDGGTYLRLTGGMRELHLANRPTRKGLQFVGQPANIIANTLIDGDNIIGPDGGLYSAPLASLSTTFKEPTTRFEALVKVAGYARVAYRESWYYDRPEYTRIDNPPDSGITLRKAANAEEAMTLSAENGDGIIADPPSIRFDGSNIVNRIIAIGSDTPEGDLTLGDASVSAPYAVQSFLNPDGSTSYYIEDTYSIEGDGGEFKGYGLVETYMVRTDVKNPSDNAGTRTAAANVLYATAAGQLLKHKSEIMVVDIPVGNGYDIWALPGEKVRLTFAGQVETASGIVTWMDEDRYFMISERHDQSDPSGVRRVRFVLQAPEIQMYIPELPGAIILPPQNTDPNPFDPDSGGGGGDPDFPQSADCCDDPGTDTPEITIGDPPSPIIVPPVIVIPPDEPDGVGGVSNLYWTSIGSTVTNTVIAPTASSVIFVLAYGDDPSIDAVSDVFIEELASDEYQEGATGGGWGEEVQLAKFKHYLVHATGPSSNWAPAALTATYAFRLTASQDITGANIDNTINQGNEVLSQPRPYSVTLNANTSVDSADSKDAIIGLYATSSTAAEFGGGTYSMTFNGFASSVAIRKNIGVTSMPTEASAQHYAGSADGGNGHLFLFVRNFRFRLVAP